MRSVRARVTLLGVVLVALALAAGGLVLRLSMERQLTTSGDDISIARANELADQIDELPPVLAAGEEGIAQVVSGKGQVLAASANVVGKPAISAFRPASSSPAVRTLRAPDDSETETYRVWALAADGPDGPVTVYVGRSLESVHEALRTLTRALVIGLPLLTVVLGLALWLVVGRALRPVERLRSEVAAISPRELDRRVGVPGTNDEVARLASTMNDVLARLDESAARERDFVGNASHELLGPVASFRTQLEVALAHPEGTDWATLTHELLEDTLGMEALVRNLLFLARADADELAMRSEPVDLGAIAREQADQVSQVSAEGVQVTVSGRSDGLTGDRAAVARAVRNLLDNAIRHARSRVQLGLADHRLVVSDDGPGVPAEHRDRIFDRFYQADPSRSHQVAGAGLGLAIARAIAEEHGGSLVLLEQSTLGGADFALSLGGVPGQDP